MTAYGAISANKRMTLFIMVLFVLFFGTVAYIIGKALGYGLTFAGVMLIISGLMSFFSYYYSDRLVLSISGAKPISRTGNRELYNRVENLCIASGLPIPRVYIINDPAPNAFATGRNPKHAAVAVTTGLLEKLKRVESEGVIAHELSHVKNYDTRLMGVVSILVGSIAILSDVFMRSVWFGGYGGRGGRRGTHGIFAILAIILAILAPIAAILIQLAVSRRREFLADADGALLTRYPKGLALALEKIATDRHVLKRASNATAHLYVVNPFKTDTGRKVADGLANLFSTHPPIEERVKILRAM